MKEFYKHTLDQIFENLQSRRSGLTNDEAKKYLEKYGYNKLPEDKTDSVIKIFLRQFQSSLIYILFFAAGVVFLMGDKIDALIIFAVLFFNAVIGSIQEGKAQNALLALKKFTETNATVLRENKEIILLDTEIVPGDVIILQEGERVPADARIIFSNNLKTDEASLTGESEPVAKFATELADNHLPVSEQKNMIFKGTNVLSGNGVAVVVATGMKTEIGKIAQKIKSVDTEIPLKNNIRFLSRLIIFIVAGISILLVFLGVLSGRPIREMFSTAVALSVSIIPEGLPIVMTLVLATGVRRMSKHNVLVKKLQAVEALGQTKIIAVDKTGTLTKNEMLVQRVWVDGKNFEILGNGYEPKGEIIFDEKAIDPLNHPELILIGKAAAFCATAKLYFSEQQNDWKISGDPTEAAMLVFSEKIGFNHEILEQETPKIFELPFDYHKKCHVAIRPADGGNFVVATGAPEKIINLCDSVWSFNGTQILNSDKKKEIEKIFHNLAQEGFRVVACAINPKFSDSTIDPEKIPPLSFLGFFAMNDALRPEVIMAMHKVKSAGMRVVMITGDHKLTAQAIAKQADIWHEGDDILTGDDIDQLSDKELFSKIANVSVFARVTPEHKLRIVQTYRQRGEIVAMTGDGVNDAPSLVAADLGMAMGKIGTEVAKEASDIVLLDDDFADIVSAAEEGRSIYKTIKKVILYLFSTSLGEIFVIMGALFLLKYPLPLLAVQIIWLNFITDGFLVVALAMEPKEKGLMKSKFEKPHKWIVDKLMAQRMFLMALPMTLGTLYLFSKYFKVDSVKSWTIALTTLAVFQWFNAWNCRSENKSIFQMNPFSNKFLVVATILVVVLQITALHAPFLQKILHTTSLTALEWLIITLIAGSVVLVEEIRKLLYQLRK